MKNILLINLILIFSFNLFSQNRQKWQTVADLQKSADFLIENRKNEWGLSEKDALVRSNEMPKTDNLGFKHYRYEQTYNGVPIEGAEWFVHEKNNIAKIANGNLVSGLQLSTVPNLSEEQALQYALNVVNAEVWAWEDDFLEAILQEENPTATYYPIGDLVIFSPDLIKGNANVESYRLAYKFEIFAASPFTRQEIFVDAHNGELITSFGLTCHVDVAASGNAHYACQNPVSFTADERASDYRLHESGRGNGIHTRSSDNTESTPTTTEVTSSDNFFDEDPDAVAAHYALEKTYDYLHEKHNRNSIDNNGYKLKIWVHYGNNLNNAGWLGYGAVLGDGDGVKYNPLTSIDIVAHEITHGLIEYTARLRYQYESGALNESFSDIFGTLVEFYAEPTCADWLIGEDVVVQSGKIATRNMANPKDASVLYQQPDTYLGEFWETGNADHGGVHTNSGVLNHWFYLIVNGGTGTNDNGLNYDVLPLDNDETIALNNAGEIVFRMLTVYMNRFSQYADARAAAIQAAEDLYGADSTKINTIINAWCAVGLGECVANPNTITLTSPNGGEIWEYGTTETITWNNTGNIDNVNILLSINGGVSWQNIATAIENNGTYEFDIPNLSTTQAIINIQDSQNTTTHDASDATFEMVACDIVSAFESSATEICRKETIDFTNTTVNATIYEWLVNDELVSTSENFSYEFNIFGTYIITLISGNGECIDEYHQIITVNKTVSANFTYVKTDFLINCYAANAHLTDYEWTIDGENVSNNSTLHYTFETIGNYILCLKISDICENHNTEVCKTVRINEPAMCNSISNFEFPATSICVGDNINFTNTSSDAASYQWRINGTLIDTTTDFNYTFDIPREYTITLIAIDADGCLNKKSENVIVYHQSTDIAIEENILQCETNSIILDAQISDMQNYLWQLNGETLGTTQTITATQSGIYDLTITDWCDNISIYNIELVIDDDCVWPGDTNYDNIVNIRDLLPIGLSFGEIGQVRQNPSFNWEGQSCYDWNNQQENGVNYKHLDANGDGIIDENDAHAIDVNYGKTHSSFDETSQINYSTINIEPTISDLPTLNPSETTTLVIDLMVNEEEDDQKLTAYGLAFNVEYTLPSNFASVSNIAVNFDGSWLGEQNELLTVWKHFPEQKTIEIALTRIDKQNALGKGKIGEVIVEIDIEAITLEEITVDFTASNIDMVLSNNTFVPIENTTATFTLTSEETCEMPTNLQENDLACDAVTLAWNEVPDADLYRLRGRKVGFPFKTFPDMANNFRTFTSGLQSNITYEWQVRAKCGDTWSSFASLQSFTTPSCKNSTYDETKDPFFVDENESFFSQINLFPNPAKNDLNISFTSFSAENVNVKVVDILGKTVLAEKIETLQGENNFTLNVKDLPSGTYFLEIENGFENTVQKFMVY